jgi:hypothetical protein
VISDYPEGNGRPMNQKHPAYIKLAIVVVLAVVFLLAVGNSIRTIGGLPSAPPVHPRRATKQPEVFPRVDSIAQGSPRQLWPTFNLMDIIANDPFAIAPADNKATGSSSPTAAQEVTKTSGGGIDTPSHATPAGEKSAAFAGRVQAIYRRNGRSAVIIDSRTLQPGDTIEGGGRIVDVDQHGVTVEIKE